MTLRIESIFTIRFLHPVAFVFLFLFCKAQAIAQPVITNVTPQSGAVNSKVTITGRNFNSLWYGNDVYFGAVRALVDENTATTTSLTVTVPAGASYQPVSVTSNYLTGSFSKPFFITYPDGGVINASTFINTSLLDSSYASETNDVVSVDFNLDGKPDVAVINRLTNQLSVYKNISTGNNIAFSAPVVLATSNKPTDITTGDLDGDRRIDIIVSDQEDHVISVYRNTSDPSTMSFDAKLDVDVGEGVLNITAADFDGDGRPDLAVTEADLAGTINILKNTSSGTTIGFGQGQSFQTYGAPNNITTGDFNSDGKPDIAAVDFVTNAVLVFINQSNSSVIAFSGKTSLPAGTFPDGIAAGDLNDDGKTDLVVSNFLSGTISVYKNISSGSSISFSKTDYITGEAPQSIAIGDLDGDAKPDIAVVNNYSSISVFKNESVAGSMSFIAGTNYPTSGSGKIVLEDINVDGKTDITVLSGFARLLFYQNQGIRPAIFSFTPATGGPNYNITISGANFTGATEVSFGGVPALSFTVVSANTIKAVVGTGASGLVKITTPYGTAEKAGFTFASSPQITSFSPDTAGTGDKVIIKGSIFIDVSSVTFGNTPASSFTVPNDTTIEAVVGAGSSGKVEIKAGGGSAARDGFIYVPPPHITSFTPAGAMPGTTVTITGTNLSNVTAVSFGQYPAVSFTSVSPVSITAVVGNEGSGYLTVATKYGKDSVPGFTISHPAVPVIASFAPTSGASGTTVTISGTNFSSVPSENTVYFGIDKAVVKSASAGSLQVIVPAGATYEPISVTVKNLTAYSSGAFLLVFGGNGYSFDESSFSKPVSVDDANYLASDLIVADFDGDGKPDMIRQGGFDSLNVFINTSTPGKISFGNKKAIYQGFSNIYIAVGDLDGDGKLDLVLDDGFYSNNITVLKNTSTPGNISFRLEKQIYFGKLSFDLDIADLDGDGKPEIIANCGYLNNEIAILPNTSVVNYPSFASPVFIAPKGGAPGIYTSVRDMNGDGKPDIVSNGTTSSLAFFKNNCRKGIFDFEEAENTAGDFDGFTAFSDLDGDTKPDLINGGYNTTSTMSVYKNLSTPDSISFADRKSFPVSTEPYGIASGDLDGDGKPDLALSNTYLYAVSVLRNKSSSNNIDLEDQVIYPAASDYVEHVTVSDMDGDGKPDIVSSGGYGNISVLQNLGKGQFIYSVCQQTDTTLVSDRKGSSYQWQINTGDGNYINVTDDSQHKGSHTAALTLTNIPFAWNDYKYRCLVDGDYSDAAKLIVNNGIRTSAYISTPETYICSRIPVSFTAQLSNQGANVTYQWMINGIAADTSRGFTTTGLKDKDQVQLLMKSNTACVVGDTVLSNVIIMQVTNSVTPVVSIAASADTVCRGTQVTFTASPVSGGGNYPIYQWLVNDAYNNVYGSTFTTDKLTNNDRIKVRIKSSETCVVPDTTFSNTITMSVNTFVQPTGHAVLPDRTCVNDALQVTFVAGNSLMPGALVQLWQSTGGSPFDSVASQSYNGSPLQFAITDNTMAAIRKYFFKLGLPATAACALPGNTDTSTTVTDELITPVLVLNKTTLTISNPDMDAFYAWQSQDTLTGQWYAVFPAATGTTYKVFSSGVYHVQANKNNCAATSAAQLVVIPVELSGNDSLTVYAYPNPAGSYLILDSLKTADKWETLEIYNSAGHLAMPVMNVRNQTRVRINTIGLMDGLYIAVLKRNSGKSSRIKFIKQ